MYNRHACINAAGRQAFNQSVSVAEAIQISLAAALSFQRRLVLAAAHEAVARTGLSGCGAQLLQRVAALRVGLVRSCLADVQALPDDCRVVRERSGWRRLGVGAGIGVAWRTHHIFLEQNSSVMVHISVNTGHTTDANSCAHS